MAEARADATAWGNDPGGSDPVDSKPTILAGIQRALDTTVLVKTPVYCVRPKNLPQYMVVFALDKP